MADSLKSEAVFTRQERIAELAKQSREFAFLSLNHYLDLMDCSYGFRPGRSAHQALGALREGLMQFGGGWLLDVDIRKFFDTLQHGSLRELLRQRIRDGVVLRLIGKERS